MKKQRMGLGLIPVILIVLFLFAACGFLDDSSGFDSTITVPYGSNEYMTQDWTLEKLKDHFDDLGFTDIKTKTDETLDGQLAGMCLVTILDKSEDENAIYREFDKDKKFDRSSKVMITQYTLIMTVDNSPEFAEMVALDGESPEWSDKWVSFLSAHSGECVEFDGVITSWYDELWFASGVSYSIAVEDSNRVKFSARNIELRDFGMTGEYHYNNYSTGMIKEGDRVHARLRLHYTEKDGLSIEFESFEIIK